MLGSIIADTKGIEAGHIVAFVLYFLLVIGIGIFFFIKGKNDTGEKGFFLGGRKMNGFVSALSAGASDMSAWVLMGLPGSIYLAGLGKVWISIGLAIGTVLAWVFVAPRLRRYSILANDSITIPQYLTNRFKSKSKVLQISAAVIFVLVYCVYGASSINACGALFNRIFDLDHRIAMAISAAVIIAYLFLGGFNAVCWTDFFQGMIMLLALMLTPIVAAIALEVPGTEIAGVLPETYYNMFSSGKTAWLSAAAILSGLGWGLGYFGMPHIIVRYMSIKSEKEMKRSRIVGSVWTILILIMATVVALVARKYLGAEYTASTTTAETIFIALAEESFAPFIAGLIITAILAASMSTADSQLLASSSAFASDIYKTAIRKKASDKEVMWVGRIVVIVATLLAFVIALLGTGTPPIVPAFHAIMDLVEMAWGAFGAAFGPIILLSLYNRRVNYKGATAGIITGFVVDILWKFLFNTEKSGICYTGLYEIIPGFLVGLAVILIVSYLTEKPSDEITALFDRVAGAKSVEVDEDGALVINGVKEETVETVEAASAEAEEKAE